MLWLVLYIPDCRSDSSTTGAWERSLQRRSSPPEDLCSTPRGAGHLSIAQSYRWEHSMQPAYIVDAAETQLNKYTFELIICGVSKSRAQIVIVQLERHWGPRLFKNLTVSNLTNGLRKCKIHSMKCDTTTKCVCLLVYIKIQNLYRTSGHNSQRKHYNLSLMTATLHPGSVEEKKNSLSLQHNIASFKKSYVVNHFDCLSDCVLSDKESGERLSRLVEEACMLLADYSGRLAAEIDDRRQLTRTLAVFLQSQRDGLAQNEQKLEVGKLTDLHLHIFPFLFILSCCLYMSVSFSSSFFLYTYVHVIIAACGCSIFGFVLPTEGSEAPISNPFSKCSLSISYFFPSFAWNMHYWSGKCIHINVYTKLKVIWALTA